MAFKEYVESKDNPYRDVNADDPSEAKRVVEVLALPWYFKNAGIVADSMKTTLAYILCRYDERMDKFVRREFSAEYWYFDPPEDRHAFIKILWDVIAPGETPNIDPNCEYEEVWEIPT